MVRRAERGVGLAIRKGQAGTSTATAAPVVSVGKNWNDFDLVDWRWASNLEQELALCPRRDAPTHLLWVGASSSARAGALYRRRNWPMASSSSRRVAESAGRAWRSAAAVASLSISQSVSGRNTAKS